MKIVVNRKTWVDSSEFTLDSVAKTVPAAEQPFGSQITGGVNLSQQVGVGGDLAVSELLPLNGGLSVTMGAGGSATMTLGLSTTFTKHYNAVSEDFPEESTDMVEAGGGSVKVIQNQKIQAMGYVKAYVPLAELLGSLIEAALSPVDNAVIGWIVPDAAIELLMEELKGLLGGFTEVNQRQDVTADTRGTTDLYCGETKVMTVPLEYEYIPMDTPDS